MSTRRAQEPRTRSPRTARIRSASRSNRAGQAGSYGARRMVVGVDRQLADRDGLQLLVADGRLRSTWFVGHRSSRRRHGPAWRAYRDPAGRADPRGSMSAADASERSHRGLVQRFAKPPCGVTCIEGSNPSLSATRSGIACARSSVDRALGCGPKGREFESRRARQSPFGSAEIDARHPRRRSTAVRSAVLDSQPWSRTCWPVRRMGNHGRDRPAPACHPRCNARMASGMPRRCAAQSLSGVSTTSRGRPHLDLPPTSYRGSGSHASTCRRISVGVQSAAARAGRSSSEDRRSDTVEPPQPRLQQPDAGQLRPQVRLRRHGPLGPGRHVRDAPELGLRFDAGVARHDLDGVRSTREGRGDGPLARSPRHVAQPGTYD